MYDLLKERMSEKEAREFVAYIESKVEGTFIEAKNIFSTKEDLLKLELRIVQQIGESNQKISETNRSIEIMRGELTQKIEQSKSDTLKWTFLYILTATIGIIATILSIMKMGGWGN